ncbi:MAG: glycosyltransferase [Proteobacteria bacterium]|nr:glycosyltransferase [Pseudomonadota bacterium]MBU1397595.1 glycosyltransferase [Pseudomonadota bacterium]MBU1570602.1 glycosyltransferase [Pseudomonadota bacterium]
MISVITPVYNGKRFIESCILNIIKQACPDIEHIIIDGGSTDGTVEIIKGYAERYDHIRWVSEKDNGQSDAMNKGILMARGSILGFLNVDDYYEPDVLRRIVELFKILPEPSLLVGNCYRWNDKGEMYELNKPAKLGITDLMLGWNVNPFPVNPSQYFYHKSLHQKIGLYNVQEHFTLDIDFLIRAVQAAHVTYRDEFWGNYRFIEGTKTFHDMQNRLCVQRLNALLNKYKKELPRRQQLLIALKRACYNNQLTAIPRYFMRDPHEFFQKLRSKLMNVFGFRH